MLNTKVRKSIVFLMSILRVGGYTVLANLVFIGICILKKVRKSIFILYAKGDLRTFEVLGLWRMPMIYGFPDGVKMQSSQIDLGKL